MKPHRAAKLASTTHPHSAKSPRKPPYRTIADFAMIGGLSALVVASLTGCDTDSSQSPKATQSSQAIKQGAFVILEEQPNGRYKVLEEYPSGSTRVVVRDLQGQERILSDEEIQTLIKQEEMRIDNGTSELTAQNNSARESSGLGLGGAILASAAGALLGSYIGNKLFNNPNYQQNKQRTYKSPQAYERSANSFKQGAQTPKSGVGAGATPSNAKGGFYGNSAAKTPQGGGGYGG